MSESEMRTCRECGRILPLSAYSATKFGGYMHTCKECVSEKREATRKANRGHIGGGKPAPYSNPDFDGKQPVEVIQLMSRAKRWLEAQGFRITLAGEYRKVEIKKIKF